MEGDLSVDGIFLIEPPSQMAMKKKAEFDLFQGPPSPKEESLDLFARPPGRRAPGPPPATPERAPGPPDLNLFGRPPDKKPQAPKPSPAPSRGKPPPLKERAPSAPPVQPTPPGQGAQGDPLARLHQDRNFKKFVEEKYEGGDSYHQHPLPELRERYPDGVKFWTAMKYDLFRKPVMRQFELWGREQEDRRPRVQIGQWPRSPAELRIGDFVTTGVSNFKVIGQTPRAIKLQEINRWGRPVGAPRVQDATWFVRNIRSRIEEVKPPDITFDRVKGYLEEAAPVAPQHINSQREYRDWLKQKLTEVPQAPFYQLTSDDTRHQEQLERHVEQILRERDIGENWTWSHPSRVAIGARVNAPRQVRVGDFVEFAEKPYRVLETHDNKIQVQEVDVRGRPLSYRPAFPFDELYLRQYKVKRIAPILRPEVSFDRAKDFAKNHQNPPKNINTKGKYREWLKTKFLNHSSSPYYGLAEDETEHQKALEKQVDKILDEQGIGADWEWQAPPEAEVGERITNPYALRPGHFMDGNTYTYKILNVEEDGQVKVLHIDAAGRPVGEAQYKPAHHFSMENLKRIDPIKRPEVSFNQFKDFVDEQMDIPERNVQTRDDYRAWLEKGLISHPASPFYFLGEEETEEKAALQQYVDRILDQRNIRKDWTWTPRPLVEFPSNADWEKKQDAIRRTVIQGQQIRHPQAKTEDSLDAPIGAQGVNESSRRRMKMPDGSYHDFVYKPKSGEQDNRKGCPSGTLHLREQASYNLDRLLGEGTVVPPTVSDGLGSYQLFAEGAKMWVTERGFFHDRDLFSHPEVQRMIILDLLQGHEDRHSSNMMVSWKDPRAPKTIDNARFYAIDNGYAFGHPDAKTSRDDFVVRHPWSETVLNSVLRELPVALQEKLRNLKTKDVVQTLIKSGITNKSLLQAVAVKLKALQNNPHVIGDYMELGGFDAIRSQREFHYNAGKDPTKLISQDELDKIKQEVDTLSSQS